MLRLLSPLGERFFQYFSIWINLIGLFGLVLSLLSDFFLFQANILLINDIPLIWLFGHIALLGVIFLKVGGQLELSYCFLATFSVYGLFLWVLNYLPKISNYPLTMGRS